MFNIFFQKTFIKPDPDQLASGVQIQEVLSPNMTSQPGTESVVYLPTTDESQDENQQTFIVVNEPQQVTFLYFLCPRVIGSKMVKV